MRSAVAANAVPRDVTVLLPGDGPGAGALDGRKMNFTYLGSRVFLEGANEGAERNQAPVKVG